MKSETYVMSLASDSEESNSSEQQSIADAATTDGLNSRNKESGRIKCIVSTVMLINIQQTRIYQSNLN